MVCRFVTADRFHQVAVLHRDSLPDGFLATLGIRFLELMYESMEGADDAFLITEERDGKVIGFVTGGIGMAGTYRRMLAHPIRLGATLAPTLLSRHQIRKIWEIIRYSTAADPAFPRAELLSLAVDPAFRGTGAADRLYWQLTEAFQEKGIARFKIVVGKALLPAQRFYRRMGASAIGEMTLHGSEVSIVYCHDVEFEPSQKVGLQVP